MLKKLKPKQRYVRATIIVLEDATIASSFYTKTELKKYLKWLAGYGFITKKVERVEIIK